MNKKDRIALASFVTGTSIVGVALIVRYRDFKRSKKRDHEINVKLAADIAALGLAHRRIQERIATGYYNDKFLADIENDFHFEVIAIQNGE